MAEPPAEETGTPIVVGVDGSLPSLRAAAWAGLEARLRGQTLHLLTSCALPPALGGIGAGRGGDRVAAGKR